MNSPGRSLFSKLLTIALLPLVLLLGAPILLKAAPLSTESSRLLRIQMVTVGTNDIEKFESLYTQWLDYRVSERGKIPSELAASWGAPQSADRDYILMHSVGTPDVWLRIVDVDVPRPQAAMTTTGWSVIEFLVKDPDAIYARLLESPFQHIGGPANLGGGTSSIRATQFIGPASVATYLTADTAALETAQLPRAKSFVDRPFIMVLATTDPDATDSFYRNTFNMGGYPPRPARIGVVTRALNLPDDHETPMGLATGAEAVNAIEIDGYPVSTPQRLTSPGQLPPAVAMVSFAVETLDGLDLQFIQPPSTLYDDRRAATFIGPAGELTELIEVGARAGQ